VNSGAVQFSPSATDSKPKAPALASDVLLIYQSIRFDSRLFVWIGVEQYTCKKRDSPRIPFMENVL
jgi:hypothetical protein